MVRSGNPPSPPADRHAADAEGRDGDGAKPYRIVADGVDARQQIGDPAGNRDLGDRIGELPALDPAADRAERQIAGRLIEAHTAELGEIEPLLYLAHDRVWSTIARN